MSSSLSRVPDMAEVLGRHGVKLKKLRAGVSEYLDLVEELLAETDTFGEAYDYLALSDRREEVATFYALLLA